MDVIAKIDAEFRAIETGDAALAAAAVAPDWIDHELHTEASLSSVRGPAALLVVSAWMRSAMPNLRFADAITVADDNHALTYVVLTGQHTGPFVVYRNGRAVRVIPPTGRRIEVRHAHVHELRDGEVVSHRAVRDDLAMLGQLGVLPPTPAGLARGIGWKISGRARTAVQEVTEAMRAAAATAPQPVA